MPPNHPDLLFTAFPVAASLLHATLHLISRGKKKKKRLRNIILVLEARNKSVFLNTFTHPEAARGWLPGGAAQPRRVRETAAITQQSPGLTIAALLGPCSPHILMEEDLFASEGIWEFSLYIQLAHKSRMLSK